jgi:DNA-binding NtrC family response regulator
MMADPARILVVDDAEATLEVLRRQLEDRGHRVWTATEVQAALTSLDDEALDLVITDLRMPGQDGLDLVRHVRENRPDLEIMMITGYASIEGAVEAVKTGVAEYLAKPFTESELHHAVERALTALERRRGAGSGGDQRLVGRALQPIRQAIAAAAHGRDPVLVTGQPGSGRSLASRLLHDLGPRAEGPFVTLPAPLMAADRAAEELIGAARQALRGTLVVDGIEQLPEAAQVPLLRLINERRLPSRGASSTAARADLGLVAIADRSPAALRRTDTLRGDLVDRLAGTTIALPSLDDHPEDVPAIAAALLARRHPGLALSDAAVDALQQAEWPGNVRELDQVLHGAALTSQGDTLEVTALPKRFRFSAEPPAQSDDSLAAVETTHIRAVLQRTGGNKSEAARILGIDRKTLREKLRRGSP